MTEDFWPFVAIEGARLRRAGEYGNAEVITNPDRFRDAEGSLAPATKRQDVGCYGGEKPPHIDDLIGLAGGFSGYRALIRRFPGATVGVSAAKMIVPEALFRIVIHLAISP